MMHFIWTVLPLFTNSSDSPSIFVWGTTTSSWTNCDILGSVVTWHSYTPASLLWTYFIWRVHVSPLWSTWNLSSAMKVYRSTVKICESRLRIQDTWKYIKAYTNQLICFNRIYARFLCSFIYLLTYTISGTGHWTES